MPSIFCLEAATLNSSKASSPLLCRENPFLKLVPSDQLPDGTHTYETTYVWENGWLLEPQHEFGRLSEKDWQILKTLRRCKDIPRADETRLGEPHDSWGTMQRGAKSIDIRYAGWRELETTQVPASFNSMVSKAKASL